MLEHDVRPKICFIFHSVMVDIVMLISILIILVLKSENDGIMYHCMVNNNFHAEMKTVSD